MKRSIWHEMYQNIVLLLTALLAFAGVLSLTFSTVFMCKELAYQVPRLEASSTEEVRIEFPVSGTQKWVTEPSRIKEKVIPGAPESCGFGPPSLLTPSRWDDPLRMSIFEAVRRLEAAYTVCERELLPSPMGYGWAPVSRPCQLTLGVLLTPPPPPRLSVSVQK